MWSVGPFLSNDCTTEDDIIAVVQWKKQKRTHRQAADIENGGLVGWMDQAKWDR